MALTLETDLEALERLVAVEAMEQRRERFYREACETLDLVNGSYKHKTPAQRRLMDRYHTKWEWDPVKGDGVTYTVRVRDRLIRWKWYRWCAAGSVDDSQPRKALDQLRLAANA